MSDTLVVEAGQHSMAGRKTHNEDSCGFFIPDNYLLQTKGIAAVIADGVSSAAAGRQASEACVQGFLQDYYSTPESWTTKTSAQKVLGALNRWLYGRSVRQHCSDLGFVTTLSALVIKSNHAYIFHIGDTRVYRYRDGELEQLTRDHRIVSNGEKTFLAHAMGVDPKLQIDYLQVDIEPNDIFILLTDGVYEFINDDSLLELMQPDAITPKLLAKYITELAYKNNSHDNVSCQVLRVERIPFHDNANAFYQKLTELPFPPPLSAGNVIDGYKIIRELHASKRTQVYLAEDQASNQHAIIKAPSINYSDDAEFIDRFLHEEWVGRRIDNQHVLKVLSHPRQRSFLYYLTEHYPGQTLRQWMIDHPSPSLSDVRTIIKQLMHGLLAFHRLEMLHQDLKPENILINNNQTVKIIDFGSAKIAGIDEISKPIDTQTAVLGTVNYSAPEILAGQTGSELCDIYSIGVITYEMLTGMLPYGDEPTTRKLQQTDYRSTRDFRPNLPAWVDGALHKAVHKNPQQRYTTLSEFIYDLSNPNPQFTQQKFEPLIERNPIRFWQLLVAIMVIINIALITALLTD